MAKGVTAKTGKGYKRGVESFERHVHGRGSETKSTDTTMRGLSQEERGYELADRLSDGNVGRRRNDSE